MRTLEDNAFLLLIIAVSLAFAWVLLPFYGAVLWGTIITILFGPLYRRLLELTKLRRNLAASALLGGFRGIGGGPFYGTGYYGDGSLGLVVVILLVLFLLGKL